MVSSQIEIKKELINGRLMAFTDVCPEGFVAIVVIHPFPFNQKVLQPLVEHLANSCKYPNLQFRVITYDIAGFGNSESRNGNFTVNQWLEDLHGLLNHLHIVKAVIGGFSLGADIAIAFANQYPSRVLALFMSDMHLFDDTEEQMLEKFQLIKEIDSEGIKEYSEFVVSSLLSPNYLDSNHRVVEELKQNVQSNSVAGITGALYALTETPGFIDVLSKIKVSKLILIGENVDEDYKNLVIKECKKLPNAELHIIPQSAYLPHIENENISNKLIFNYINKIYNSLMESSFQEVTDDSTQEVIIN